MLESEAESLFIEVLKTRAESTEGGSFKSVMRDGYPGYELSINNVTWEIHCQVLLKRSDGVSIQCKPDFLFKRKGDRHAKPLAIFVDGFAFHRHILEDDTSKRMATLFSQKYLVWSLSWDDLFNGSSDQSEYYTDYLSLEDPYKFNTIIHNLLKDPDARDLIRKYQTANSLELFWSFVQKPDSAQWQALAVAHALAKINAPCKGDWPTRLPYWFAPDTHELCGVHREKTDLQHEAMIMVRSTAIGAQNLEAEALQVATYLDDTKVQEKGFREAWNGFLRVMNVFQFLPRVGFFCESGLQDHTYDNMEAPADYDRYY